MVTVGVGGGERRAGEVVDVVWKRGDGGAIGRTVDVGRHGACGERTVVPIIMDNLECRKRNYMV